jgi:hypothetical protein
VIPAVEADQDIVDLQPHIGIEFTREEDIDIYSGGEHTQGPEKAVLLYFQDYVKDPR